MKLRKPGRPKTSKLSRTEQVAIAGAMWRYRLSSKGKLRKTFTISFQAMAAIRSRRQKNETESETLDRILRAMRS